jgi:hypothetical protein
MAKPPRKSGQRVSLTPATVKRIARCVLAFERGNKDIPALPMRTSGGDDSLARGTFTGAWSKGSTATVTDSALSSVTYEAKNYFSTISNSGGGTKACAIAYVAGEWILIAVEC